MTAEQTVTVVMGLAAYSMLPHILCIMVVTFARTGENNVLGTIPWLLQFQREVNGNGDRDR